MWGRTGISSAGLVFPVFFWQHEGRHSLCVPFNGKQSDLADPFGKESKVDEYKNCMTYCFPKLT